MVDMKRETSVFGRFSTSSTAVRISASTCVLISWSSAGDAMAYSTSSRANLTIGSRSSNSMFTSSFGRYLRMSSVEEWL